MVSGRTARVSGRASAVAGLSPTDLERIRDTLATGRKPKVVFNESAGQIAGQVGQVVALTDPQLSDEWLVVRFGRDELPFAPTDLSIASRSTSRKAGASVPAPREEAALSQLVSAPHAAASAGSVDGSPAADATSLAGDAAVSTPEVSSGADVSDAPDVSGGAREGRRAADDAPAEASRPVAERVAASPGAEVGGGERAERSAAGRSDGRLTGRAAARKATRTKPAASLTVTLGYSEGEWTVSAVQGNRTLARPCSVRAAEALKMVSMLDVPAVQEAVEEIIAAARLQAQQQADKLRAELAEVEARLAELREDS